MADDNETPDLLARLQASVDRARENRTATYDVIKASQGENPCGVQRPAFAPRTRVGRVPRGETPVADFLADLIADQTTLTASAVLEHIQGGAFFALFNPTDNTEYEVIVRERR